MTLGKLMPAMGWCLSWPLLLALGLSAVAQAEVPATQAPPVMALADFARQADFSRVKLSPSGKYVAAIMVDKDQQLLAIFATGSRKQVNALGMAGGEKVLDYWWSGPEQLVFTLGNSDGPAGEPVATGELLALKPSGSPDYLFGYRGEGTLGSHVVRETFANGYVRMVDPTPDDPESVLVSAHYWPEGPDVPETLTIIGNNGR